MSVLALFRRFPGLAGSLPHRAFLAGPTPVEPLPLAGLRDGSVWIKRDERSCPLYGGNKPRKLEFVLGAVLARGARRVLTSGALGTHHGLATTRLAREVGLATTLVLVDQPLTAEVRANLRLCAAWGAELRYGRNVAGAIAQGARVLLRGLARRERVALIPTGGSGAVGNVGLVSAGLELAEQIERAELPDPAAIWVAVGTGGSHAGLVLGLRLAGLTTPVRGVLVTDILPPSPRLLLRQARATWRRLHAADRSVPEVKLSLQDFPLVTDQLGPGYGAATPAAEAARRAAAAAGVQLEPTYTAKCLAALIARGATPGAPALFWNTYNDVDVSAGVPVPPEAVALPPVLERRLARRV